LRTLSKTMISNYELRYFFRRIFWGYMLKASLTLLIEYYLKELWNSNYNEYNFLNLLFPQVQTLISETWFKQVKTLWFQDEIYIRNKCRKEFNLSNYKKNRLEVCIKKKPNSWVPKKRKDLTITTCNKSLKNSNQSFKTIWSLQLITKPNRLVYFLTVEQSQIKVQRNWNFRGKIKTVHW